MLADAPIGMTTKLVSVSFGHNSHESKRLAKCDRAKLFGRSKNHNHSQLCYPSKHCLRHLQGLCRKQSNWQEPLTRWLKKCMLQLLQHAASDANVLIWLSSCISAALRAVSDLHDSFCISSSQVIAAGLPRCKNYFLILGMCNLSW